MEKVIKLELSASIVEQHQLQQLTLNNGQQVNTIILYTVQQRKT